MKQFCTLASFAILVAILIGLDAVGILVGILYCCILFSRNKMNLKSIKSDIQARCLWCDISPGPVPY